MPTEQPTPIPIRLDPRWRWCSMSILDMYAWLWTDRPVWNPSYESWVGGHGYQCEFRPVNKVDLSPSALYEIIDGAFHEREKHP